MKTHLWAIGLVVLGTLIGSFGPILLKKASHRISGLKSIIDKYLIGGFLLYGLATLVFIPALKGGELSVLYPFVALSYVWVSLLSVKILSEKMNSLKWIGISLIILGVTFIGLGA